jgi:mannose-6-phosphate isomerase-like protein (cupin superfamily)
VHEHCKVGQPRGFYDSLERGECFQVKRLVVKPGERLSLQLHHHRSEHWTVVRGTALVTRGEERFLLAENQSTLIPLGVTHRFENAGKTPLEVIEVQSGGYLGEDDIVRFDDQYGRDQAGGEAGNAALRQAALKARARGSLAAGRDAPGYAAIYSAGAPSLRDVFYRLAYSASVQPKAPPNQTISLRYVRIRTMQNRQRRHA